MISKWLGLPIFMAGLIIGVSINPLNNWFDRQMVQEILADYQGNLYKARMLAYNEAFDDFYDRLSKSNMVLQKTVWIQGTHLKIDLEKTFVMVKNGSALGIKGEYITINGGYFKVYNSGLGIKIKSLPKNVNTDSLLNRPMHHL